MISIKKTVYAWHGVQEYLVLQVYEQAVSWFSLRNGMYEPLAAAADGIVRSRVFPGLWLHSNAFWINEMATVLAVLQQGLTSTDYHAFREHLGRR